MKQIRIFLLLAVLIFAVTGFGQDTRSAADASPTAGDAVYARPGQLVSAADGARLNLYCMGSGSPTVVFDSGWGDWAPAWSKVQPRIAKWTRACSYDRAGTGFSDPGPLPRTSVRIADELHSALHNARTSGLVLPGPPNGRRRLQRRELGDRASGDRRANRHRKRSADSDHRYAAGP